jgi:chromosome segregation ATPase
MAGGPYREAGEAGARDGGDEVLDLRVENELLRSMLKDAEAAPARLKELTRAHEVASRELETLRRELDAVREDRDLQAARLGRAVQHERELERTLGVLRADYERLQAAYAAAREARLRTGPPDEAFVRRLIEERDELARELREARAPKPAEALEVPVDPSLIGDIIDRLTK